MKTSEAGEMVLEGVVIPVAWGPNGEVTDVGLAALDETEYRIDRGIAWEHSLRDYLRKRVRLSAVLESGRVIQVRSVEVVASAGPGAQHLLGRMTARRLKHRPTGS